MKENVEQVHIKNIYKILDDLREQIKTGFTGVYARQDKTNGLVGKNKEWIDKHYDIDENLQYAIALSGDKYSAAVHRLEGFDGKLDTLISRQSEKMEKLEEKINGMALVKFKTKLIWGFLLWSGSIIGTGVIGLGIYYLQSKIN